MAKQLLAEQGVINRHSHSKLQNCPGSAAPEFNVVFPTSKEKFPLQFSHLDQLSAPRSFHPGVFKLHEECRHKHSFSVTKIVKHVEPLPGVLIRLARHTNH